jgi:ATP-dependent RNA helicase RhlE
LFDLIVEQRLLEKMTFADLGLSEDRLAAIEALGWTHPTPIQTKAIPAGLEGKDVVGIAQTGTGKTGAFLLPGIEQIKAGAGLQIVVLCPTRELAQQVQEDAEAFCKGSTIRSAVIVGGVGYGPQNDALASGVEIITATPGRFNDHLERGNVKLGTLRMLVLDEADRMLDMGFRPQIEDVLRKSPKNRQTMLFSATMPQGVHALALQVSKDALWAEASPEGTTAEGITELVYSVRPDRKVDLLLHLLSEPQWDQVLVFTRMKVGADVLRTHLERAGITVETMHSDRQMSHRARALDRFTTGEARVLVATDIAQRGLDVEGISHVVNFDIPTDPEDYVHRIGRTGRAGAVGTAVTFVTALELGYLKSIEYRLGRTLERIHLEEFDYSGAPVEAKSGRSRKHSRTSHGMGSKRGQKLSPEELSEILGMSS